MTAVEFYHEEMLEMERKWQMQDLNFGQWKEMAVEALRKAKEMEKEQIINSYENGDENGANRVYYHSDRDDKSAEQYYNETFKSKGNEQI